MQLQACYASTYFSETSRCASGFGTRARRTLMWQCYPTRLTLVNRYNKFVRLIRHFGDFVTLPIAILVFSDLV
jgi:hypothetical protein